MVVSLLLTVTSQAQILGILYDDGNPTQVDTGRDAYVSVRFTPHGPMTLTMVEFMVINESGSSEGCHVWIADDQGNPPRVSGICTRSPGRPNLDQVPAYAAAGSEQ